MSKYHSRKTTVDGITFDSRKEARRYQELRLLEKAGEIWDLNRQVPYILLPVQRDPDTGKALEREVKYIADFVYWDKDGYHVEDAKGVRTKDYIIKRKLLLWKYGLKIEEV